VSSDDSVAEVVEEYTPHADTFDAIEVVCEYDGEGRSTQLDQVRLRWYEMAS